MRYLLLLHSDPAHWDSLTPGQMAAVIEDHREVIHELQAGGKYLASEPLLRDAVTTVRVRDGRSDVVDGPFAESKELLAGFYLVDLADLDEALAVAARIPDARVGGVEIRPVTEITMPGEEVSS